MSNINPLRGGNCISAEKLRDIKFGFYENYDETNLAIYYSTNTNEEEVREKLKEIANIADTFTDEYWNRQTATLKNTNCEFSETWFRQAIISSQNSQELQKSLPETKYIDTESNNPPVKVKNDCSRLSLTFVKIGLGEKEINCYEKTNGPTVTNTSKAPIFAREFDIYVNQF